ncbi:MAG TPA: DNA-3-methyladenine glycosylase I [Clostridia bacterium]|nr:DNA-3-methyladenine glycosylase I [Clostridia bacterium]
MIEARNGCGWEYGSVISKAYHDDRWCNPVHDERELFAMLCLEGMQAGLSWSIILKREAGMREAFDGFDPDTIAKYNEADFTRLMGDNRIIRNRRKVEAAADNARAFLEIQHEFGSFDAYVWGFTGGKVVMNHPKALSDVPVKSELSELVSRDLTKRGFRFVGPVIIYSYLQSIGIINDHLESCSYKY